jgi:hypothetical protein
MNHRRLTATPPHPLRRSLLDASDERKEVSEMHMQMKKAIGAIVLSGVLVGGGGAIANAAAGSSPKASASSTAKATSAQSGTSSSSSTDKCPND